MDWQEAEEREVGEALIRSLGWKHERSAQQHPERRQVFHSGRDSPSLRAGPRLRHRSSVRGQPLQPAGCRWLPHRDGCAHCRTRPRPAHSTASQRSRCTWAERGCLMGATPSRQRSPAYELRGAPSSASTSTKQGDPAPPQPRQEGHPLPSPSPRPRPLLPRPYPAVGILQTNWNSFPDRQAHNTPESSALTRSTPPSCRGDKSSTGLRAEAAQGWNSRLTHCPEAQG